MLRAKILVHKAAMPIAIHAVRTFAAVSGGQYSLDLHSDVSLDEADIDEMEVQADDIFVDLLPDVNYWTTCCNPKTHSS